MRIPATNYGFCDGLGFGEPIIWPPLMLSVLIMWLGLALGDAIICELLFIE